MGKDKIRKFKENETFRCLIQPPMDEVLGKEHPLKGNPLKGNWDKEVFHNGNPIVLELGCGKGEYTIALAERFPEKNFIGVDIKGARLWKGAKYAHEHNMPNVAFLRTRIDFIDSLFGPDEVSEIWLTFSKTDSQLLHESTLEVIKEGNHTLLEADNDIYGSGLAEREPLLSIKTFYESMFLAEGKPITYVRWRL